LLEIRSFPVLGSMTWDNAVLTASIVILIASPGLCCVQSKPKRDFTAYSRIAWRSPTLKAG
jgi:hypothetical protein